MELKKGTTLHGGMYTIEKTLGRGSFGITYLATAKIPTESGLGKLDVIAKVAIKEFFMSDVNARKEDGSTVEGSSGSVFTNYRRKFRKEAENLAKLLHPNIVHVFDVFDENGTSYYAMEFLDGGNLDDYIMSQGKLPEKRSLEIVRTIGGALSYMHSKKMLHLDMKPKNVMYSPHISLIDFGLSKQYTEDGEPESSTTIGLGTPGYAPVEQSSYRPDGTFPATLDVYALGATMFKMLTGQRPPDASVLLNDGFPSKGFEGVSAQTVAAVKKAMNPVRKDRFQSVDEFMAALPRVAAAEPNDEEKTEVQVVDVKPERAPEPPTPVIYEPNPKEHYIGDEPAPAAPHTLKSVWKSNKGIVNFFNVASLLVFGVIWIIISGLFLIESLYFDIDYPQTFIVSFILFFSPYFGMYGIIRMMYGVYHGWKIPILIYVLLSVISFFYGILTFSIVCAMLCTYSISILVIRPMNIKSVNASKDSKSVSNTKWNIIGLSTLIVLSSILIFYFLGEWVSANNGGYHSYVLNILAGTIFCFLLTAQKRVIGLYLLIPLLLTPYITYFYFYFPLDIEYCILAGVALLLIAFSIKVKGKNTFAILK